MPAAIPLARTVAMSVPRVERPGGADAAGPGLDLLEIGAGDDLEGRGFTVDDELRRRLSTSKARDGH
ncbi:hypothetical protein [Actinomadura citrea]|uniref:Uncharacterized protein n=1 Tax=Actinomadura citrea TaxID=46158 RepID=A0A7Y9KEV2_9ACTN|nr:hypothetical protein [Actinomadura citrea]NYE16642.1 hypothetical protein [Actinomadura citrea]